MLFIFNVIRVNTQEKAVKVARQVGSTKRTFLLNVLSFLFTRAILHKLYEHLYVLYYILPYKSGIYNCLKIS